MTINDYIKKNLFSINFNVLASVYEENGSELTEEIKAYLKETPWNTNWNVLSGMNGNDSGDGDTTEIPKVYVTRQGVDSENSDIKNDNDVIAFISNNYELSPTESSVTGYEAIVKNNGTPIQFYVNSTPCRTNHITISPSSSSTTESINTVQLKFYSEIDSDYGIYVNMWKPESYSYIRIYDDRE